MQLEAEGISYRYGSNWLMENLNLIIKPGEVIGLFGQSGSGKTTLAQIIASYLEPNTGVVKVDGTLAPVQGVHPVQLVLQHPEKVVNPKWRLEHTLREGGGPDKNILELLEIKQEWLKRWPSELSGGELQRICIARGLGPATQYLIADEMTTMLDALTQAQIWHTVLQLVKQRHLGVLAISHNRHLLKRISHSLLDFNEIAITK